MITPSNIQQIYFDVHSDFCTIKKKNKNQTIVFSDINKLNYLKYKIEELHLEGFEEQSRKDKQLKNTLKSFKTMQKNILKLEKKIYAQSDLICSFAENHFNEYFLPLKATYKDLKTKNHSSYVEEDLKKLKEEIGTTATNFSSTTPQCKKTDEYIKAFLNLADKTNALIAKIPVQSSPAIHLTSKVHKNTNDYNFNNTTAPTSTCLSINPQDVNNERSEELYDDFEDGLLLEGSDDEGAAYLDIVDDDYDYCEDLPDGFTNEANMGANSQPTFAELKAEKEKLSKNYESLIDKYKDITHLEDTLNVLNMLEGSADVLHNKSINNSSLNSVPADEIIFLTSLISDLQEKISNKKNELIQIIEAKTKKELLLKNFDALFLPLDSNYKYLEFRLGMGSIVIKNLKSLLVRIETAIQKFSDLTDNLTSNELINSFLLVQNNTKNLIKKLENDRENKDHSEILNSKKWEEIKDKWKKIQSKNVDFNGLFEIPKVGASSKIIADLLSIYQNFETLFLPLYGNYKELKSFYSYDSTRKEYATLIKCLEQTQAALEKFSQLHESDVKNAFIENAFIPLKEKLINLFFKVYTGDSIWIRGIGNIRKINVVTRSENSKIESNPIYTFNIPPPEKTDDNKSFVYKELEETYLALKNRYDDLRKIIVKGPHILSGLKFHQTKVEEAVQKLMDTPPYNYIKDEETKNDFIENSFIPLKNDIQAFIEDVEKKVSMRASSCPDWSFLNDS